MEICKHFGNIGRYDEKKKEFIPVICVGPAGIPIKIYDESEIYPAVPMEKDSCISVELSGYNFSHKIVHHYDNFQIVETKDAVGNTLFFPYIDYTSLGVYAESKAGALLLALRESTGALYTVDYLTKQFNVK